MLLLRAGYVRRVGDGIPLRATAGARGLASGQIEFKWRSESDPNQVELLAQSDAVRLIAERVRELFANAEPKAN